MSTKPKDMKEGLSSARKADITHVRKAFMVYTSRPCEYGSARYERGNFARAVSDTPGTPTKADFLRFRAYLRAAQSHIVEVLDSMEMHQANDPNLEDIEGMKKAAFAVDTDVPPNGSVGPSFLPHVAPACASLMMAVTQATKFGLLPEDPGQPWVLQQLHALHRDTEQILTDIRVANGAYDVVTSPVQGGLAADLCPGESDLLEDAAKDAKRHARHDFLCTEGRT